MHIFGACVRITTEQIPGLSRILHLDFTDFTQLNSFSGTFQVLKILQTNFQDFAGPNSFSRTFQVLEILQTQFHYLPELSRIRGNRVCIHLPGVGVQIVAMIVSVYTCMQRRSQEFALDGPSPLHSLFYFPSLPLSLRSRVNLKPARRSGGPL